MNKFLLIIMTLVFSHQIAWSQAYEVESLELNVKDLTARTQSRVDANGRKCGILKIYVNDEIPEVRGNIIGDIKVSGLEKIVYFSHDTKQLELIFRNHIPLNIIFRDYGFPTLSGELTYVLKLKENNTYSGKGDAVWTDASTRSENIGIYNEIYNAYDAGLYKKAFDLCKSIQDDPYAQNFMAIMFLRGHGVTQDPVAAQNLFCKAAGSGYAPAQNQVGTSYSNNPKEAFEWVRKAALQGYPAAQYNLGNYYAGGYGVKQDDDEAINWFRKAAEKGFDAAYLNLGYMYNVGRGVPKNYSEALRLYRKAADLGNVIAQYNMGVMYKNGQGVAKNIEEAKKWFKKAADQGHVEARNMLNSL